MDEITPFKETHETIDIVTRVATLSEWSALREIRFLDLTHLPDIPSIFDTERTDDRTNLKFLSSFVKEVTKPIEKDGREHIEYVPTQIFTEFIRRLVKYKRKPLDGIMYPSSRATNGVCCVIFCGKEGCAENEETVSSKSVVKKVLRLVSNSDKVIEPGKEIWE